MGYPRFVEQELAHELRLIRNRAKQDALKKAKEDRKNAKQGV